MVKILAGQHMGPDGRNFEIQRLIERSRRSISELSVLEERTIWVNCNVTQADCGIRPAAITWTYMVLVDTFNTMREREMIGAIPIKDSAAAVRVGRIGGISSSI
jgi:ribonuclease PH